MSWSIISVSLAIICLQQNLCYVNALDNGVALTPPMGWMTWQRFRCITGKTGSSLIETDKSNTDTEMNWFRHILIYF